MRNESVNNCLAVFKFIIHWFVTIALLGKSDNALHANDDRLFFK